MNLQRYRSKQVSSLTNEIGVYALCDLDRVPIYVGLSTDGIRSRVRRHLTSARSDVIANRLLDVWEVAFVWAWPMPDADREHLRAVERYFANKFHRKKPLMNGSIPIPPSRKPILPAQQEVMILPETEIEKRKDPLLRLPRQASQFNSLFSHILEVKDNADLRRALEAHFERLSTYYRDFMSQSTQSPVSESEYPSD
jgi:hypothetical protein